MAPYRNAQQDLPDVFRFCCNCIKTIFFQRTFFEQLTGFEPVPEDWKSPVLPATLQLHVRNLNPVRMYYFTQILFIQRASGDSNPEPQFWRLRCSLYTKSAFKKRAAETAHSHDQVGTGGTCKSIRFCFEGITHSKDITHRIFQRNI